MPKKFGNTWLNKNVTEVGSWLRSVTLKRSRIRQSVTGYTRLFESVAQPGSRVRMMTKTRKKMCNRFRRPLVKSC